MDQRDAARRPLKTRHSVLARRVARRLARSPLTPNQISLASVAFAALAAGCLWLTPRTGGYGAVLWPLLAAVFVQCRLLCNLFDGMVAVEGGRAGPAGELFNDMPDRVADPLILVAAGYAVGVGVELGLGDGVTAGWLAALLAVLTAYVRTLSVSLGLAPDFRGPMAKPQRMAVITAACLLTPLESLLHPGPAGYVMLAALWLIIAGSALTLYRRTLCAYRSLHARADV